MRIYGWELLAVCHHPKSRDHKHCDSGGMFLICHVSSREHILKGLCEFGWKPFRVSHQLAMFGDHWYSASGDIKYLIYPVTSNTTRLRDQVTL